MNQRPSGYENWQAVNGMSEAPRKSKNKKTRKKKTKTQTNSGQNHKEKAPRKATHIQRKEKELSDISVKSIMRAARG